MTSVCRICSRSLTKQMLNKDGSVLSDAQKKEHSKVELLESRTLECKSCSEPCFTSLESSYILTLEEREGKGLCVSCGGNHKEVSINALIWSCPVHGLGNI